MDSFETFPEQDEAKRLLRAALAEGPAHAYLFHGPRGVGKRRAAFAFAGELLRDPDRTTRRVHPDLYVLEPLGDQIRIDPIRELRRDLHMRPFEAERRVYLVLGADLMNEDAADALLKDLEEPPPYAVIVLVADELGLLPPTIRSRCQLVPFRRLSQRAIKAFLSSRGRGRRAARRARARRRRPPRPGRAAARSRGGRPPLRPDRARALRLPRPGLRRRGRLAPDHRSRPRAGGEGARRPPSRRRAPTRPRGRPSSASRRAGRGAEREQILEALDLLSGWYRDLVVVAAGADGAVLNTDRLADLSADGVSDRGPAAERAAETVREVWRTFEFNVQPGLALEALFVRLRRELAGTVAV